MINTDARVSQRNWQSIWQRVEEEQDTAQYSREIYIHCCTAWTLFFSIWALILKYWFWRLLYCPAWIGRHRNVTLIVTKSFEGIPLWSIWILAYDKGALDWRQKEKEETAEAFTILQDKNNVILPSDVPKQICPILSFHLNFTDMNFHDWPALRPHPPPSCKHCKIGAWGHETFKNPAFLQAGGGCTCRLPFTAALRFRFIALHALAGKALASSKWLGQGCTDRLAQ